MMWMWAMAQALAAPDAYPLVADVTLPATGAARLHLPPELRSLDDPGNATDVLLVDGTGRPVPVVRVSGGPRWRPERLEVEVAATTDPDTFAVDLGRFPLDGLEVSLVGSAEAATVSVFQGDARVAGPTLVWRLPGGGVDIVPLPALQGKVKVRLERHGPPAPRQPPRLVGLRLGERGVPADVITVDPGPPRLQENGWAVHELPLDRPLPIARVRLHPAEENFERLVSVVGHPWDQLNGLRIDGLAPTGSQVPLRRVTFGDVAAELTELDAPRGAERLTLLVAAFDRPPLDVETVDLELDGVHLIVLDAGPGPHLLYAGAEPGTSPTWDLAAATAELARGDLPVVEPVAPRDNPEFVPPEERANLVAPSTPLEVEGLSFSRVVQGDPGPVRIPLPPDVLADAQPFLHDLRLAHDGLKVPHIVRQRPSGPVLEGVTWERTEDGSRSLLRVTLPRDGVPVASLVLSSSAPVFDRMVTVQVASGAQLRTVRAVRWVGGDRPGRLAIDLDQHVGESLLVVVDNGDDPPLPVEDVQLRVPGWEVVAVLPEGETRLYYGDPARDMADFDLVLLQSSLRRRTLPIATLAEAEPVARAPLSLLDRGMLGVGLGVLGVGLLALLLELLRRAPTQKTDYPEEASAPEAP